MKGPAGYVLESCQSHPRASRRGFVLQHRLVMEEHLHRFLTEEEVVHHLNQDRADNRLENLQLMLLGEHQRHHGRTRPRKWNDPETIETVRLAAEDPSISIASLGLSPITVASICRRHQIRWIPRHLSLEVVTLTEEKVREALQGRTTLEAALFLGVNHNTLRNKYPWLLTKRSSPDVLAGKRELVLQLLGDHSRTVQSIAEELGCHEETVRQSVRRWIKRGAIPAELGERLRRPPGPKLGSRHKERRTGQ